MEELNRPNISIFKDYIEKKANGLMGVVVANGSPALDVFERDPITGDVSPSASDQVGVNLEQLNEAISELQSDKAVIDKHIADIRQLISDIEKL